MTTDKRMQETACLTAVFRKHKFDRAITVFYQFRCIVQISGFFFVFIIVVHNARQVRIFCEEILVFLIRRRVQVGELARAVIANIHVIYVEAVRINCIFLCTVINGLENNSITQIPIGVEYKFFRQIECFQRIVNMRPFVGFTGEFFTLVKAVRNTGAVVHNNTKRDIFFRRVIYVERDYGIRPITNRQTRVIRPIHQRNCGHGRILFRISSIGEFYRRQRIHRRSIGRQIIQALRHRRIRVQAVYYPIIGRIVRGIHGNGYFTRINGITLRCGNRYKYVGEFILHKRKAVDVQINFIQFVVQILCRHRIGRTFFLGKIRFKIVFHANPYCGNVIIVHKNNFRCFFFATKQV